MYTRMIHCDSSTGAKERMAGEHYSARVSSGMPLQSPVAVPESRHLVLTG
jgi:hypothetical protein